MTHTSLIKHLRIKRNIGAVAILYHVQDFKWHYQERIVMSRKKFVFGALIEYLYIDNSLHRSENRSLGMIYRSYIPSQRSSTLFSRRGINYWRQQLLKMLNDHLMTYCASLNTDDSLEIINVSLNAIVVLKWFEDPKNYYK